MRWFKAFLLGIICTFIFSTRASAQANVNEALETAFIYVDQFNGNDGNPGTAGQPLKTIGAGISMAEDNNGDGVGSRVIVNPGFYREALNIMAPYNETSLPITVEAAISGTAIVSGSQQFTGWQVYPGNNSIYTNAWPYSWGLCNTLSSSAPPAPDIVLRQEMIFVNGLPMTQVLSFSEVTVGTFYVDEAGGTVYLWPPVGVNMAAAQVEVAVEPTILNVQGQSNLVIRGLTFEYANSCRENAAVTLQSTNPASNVLFDQDNFFWNNSQGLNFSSSYSDFTVQNSVANHNGEAGFQATMVKYGLYQNDSANFNNWRGAQGAYYVWNSGGQHFYEMHDLTLTNITTSYNQTFGVHLDTDNKNISINSTASFGNIVAQMFIEKAEGPTTISNSSLCSGNPSNYATNVALKIRNSEFLSVTGSNLVNTAQAIWIMGSATPLQVTDWETNQVYNLLTQNLTVMQNVLEGGSNQDLFSDSLGGTAWTDFQTTLISNYNTWWNATAPTPFIIPGSPHAVSENFSGWQTSTQQDQQSTWTVPGGNPAQACSAQPDISDFWFVVPYNASPATVAPGQAATYAASTVPLRFSQNNAVQLSFDGVQNIPGATASWNVNSISPNQTATFTVNTSSTTPAGTYQITLIGQNGNLTHTIVVMLTVT